jgi:hypothetical protein
MCASKVEIILSPGVTFAILVVRQKILKKDLTPKELE